MNILLTTFRTLSMNYLNRMSMFTSSVELARNKTKMAAWFVSNCDTPSQREQYVQVLQVRLAFTFTYPLNPVFPKV